MRNKNSFFVKGGLYTRTYNDSVLLQFVKTNEVGHLGFKGIHPVKLINEVYHKHHDGLLYFGDDEKYFKRLV